MFLLVLFLVPLHSSANTIESLGAISHWSFEETSGVRADSISNNDLNDSNTVGYSSGVGGIGNAADFENGNSESLWISDASQVGLDITSDLTISLWARFESNNISGGQSLMGKRDGGGSASIRAYALWSNANNSTSYDVNISNGTTNTWKYVTWEPSTGVWYHLCLNYDASAGSAEFYVDGAQQGSTQTGLPTSITNNSEEFRIGADNYSGGTNFFDGRMDEASIFDSVVSCNTLYNSGTPLDVLDEATSTSDGTSSLFFVSYADNMPKVESVTASGSDYVINYATSTEFYPTPENIFIIFLTGVITMFLMGFLAYKFL
jgi:hypothetical protein